VNVVPLHEDLDGEGEKPVLDAWRGTSGIRIKVMDLIGPEPHKVISVNVPDLDNLIRNLNNSPIIVCIRQFVITLVKSYSERLQIYMDHVCADALLELGAIHVKSNAVAERASAAAAPELPHSPTSLKTQALPN
jgi:hypothetical protein